MNHMRLFATGSVLALIAGTNALAQPPNQTTPTAASAPSVVSTGSSSGTNAGASTITTAAAQPSTLTEVVVTAQRRSENLQRAAVSVDAVSGTDLIRNGVTDPNTLSNLVPGLAVATSGGGLVSYFVRGVGNFAETPIGNPAIAFNLDNVYIGRPIASTGPFFDLDRVEVLKGPQGTLYGRNATAGAINVLPTKPELGQFGGYVDASYGNYDAYNVEGAVNAPVGDKTAIRLSADFVGHDGYLSDGTSDQDTKAVRLQVLTQIVPKLSVRLSFDYADIGGVGAGSNYVDTATYNPATGQFTVHNSGLGPSVGLYDPRSQAFLETATASTAKRNDGPLSPYPFENNKLWGVHAEIIYDTGFGTLTLIPSWRPTSVSTFSAVPSFEYQLNERDNDYSAELRFAGKRVSIFDYTLGALYFRETQKGAFEVNAQSVQDYQTFDDSTTSYAGFGRLTAHLTDRLRLVGGVRYSTDALGSGASTTGLALVCVAPACPTAPLFPFTTTLATQPVPHPAKPGVALAGPGLILAETGESLNSTANNHRTTYRGALEYDVTPRSLLYGSVETGYRSGGFNTAEGFDTYQPEYITAYTVGSKNRFFDNRLEANAELFVWNYRNQQVSHLADDLAGNIANITQNVGRSINQGAEIEARYLVTPTTIVNANIQYLDAHYSDYVYDVPVQGGEPFTGCRVTPASATLLQVNCSGKASYNSPQFTLDLGAQQTWRFGDYRIVGFVNTQYLTSRYVGFDYGASELAPPVWHTNAQLTLSPDYAKWSVAVFAQNLEDNRYATQAVQNPFASTLVDTTAPPRTYGVRVSTRF